MTDYIPHHFKPEELVPKDVFTALGSRSLILMDARILWTIDMVREYFGVVIVNNWHKGGPFGQRGFRNDSNTGAVYSQHRYGRGIDFDVVGKAAEEVRQFIISKQDRKDFQYITAMEIGTTWVHIDCRNQARIDGKITLIKP